MTLSLWPILRAAAVAGLAAGLLAALFHLALTEPIIEQAIGLEEQLHGADPTGVDPLVSRDVQRYGLVVGFAIYGLCWGLLLAAAYWFGRRWLPGSGPLAQAAILAILGYWAVAALPFLKYPANPPGVGDPETISYRQLLYLAAVILSLLTAAVSIAIARRFPSRSGAAPLRWVLGGALLAVGSFLIYAALPANPDPIHMPMDLMAAFRALSIAGLTLFWVLLGAGFALLLQRAARPTPA